MHTALWCLTAVSILGAVGLVRATQVRAAWRSGDAGRADRRRPGLRRCAGIDERAHRVRAQLRAAERLMRIGEVAELIGTTLRGRSATTRRSGCWARAASVSRASTAATPLRTSSASREIVRLRDLLGLSLDQLSKLLEAETARAEIRREYRETEDPERQRWLLEQAARPYRHAARARPQTRLGELSALERELSEKRALSTRNFAALRLIRAGKPAGATP